MTRLEQALDDCAARIAAGEWTLEEAVARYPQHASELRRLLAAAQKLRRGAEVRTPHSLRATGRDKLAAHLRAHPRRQVRRPQVVVNRMRLAFRIGAVLAALMAAGTAAAQAALPGDALYGWKLASEQVWRAVYPDHLSVDMALARRRADELIRVAADDEARAAALRGYEQAVVALSAYTDPASRAAIDKALADQNADLQNAGIALPEGVTLPPITLPPAGADEAPLPETLTGAPPPTATPLLPQPNLSPPLVASPPPLLPPSAAPSNTPRAVAPGATAAFPPVLTPAPSGGVNLPVTGSAVPLSLPTP